MWCITKVNTNYNTDVHCNPTGSAQHSFFMVSFGKEGFLKEDTKSTICKGEDKSSPDQIESLFSKRYHKESGKIRCRIGKISETHITGPRLRLRALAVKPPLEMRQKTQALHTKRDLNDP